MLYRTTCAVVTAISLLSMLTVTAASAADFSASGTLIADNQAALFAFTVPAPAAPVTIRTFGYGGGTNASSSSFNAGGSDPVLSLFGSDFQVIGYHEDGTAGTVPSDPSTGIAADAAWQLSLPSGSYFVALSQYDNFAAGPSMADGFLYSDPNFTSQYGTPGSRFLDSGGNQRSGAWAYDLKRDFSNPASQTVGTEFICTSVTADFPVNLVPLVTGSARATPHNKYFNGSQRGYALCTLTSDTWRTDFRVVATAANGQVVDPNASASTAASFVVRNGVPGAVRL